MPECMRLQTPGHPPGYRQVGFNRGRLPTSKGTRPGVAHDWCGMHGYVRGRVTAFTVRGQLRPAQCLSGTKGRPVYGFDSMSMTQLVLGCTVGFIIAQGLLYALRRWIGGRGKPAPAADADEKSLPLSYVRVFIRYAAPVFASLAFVLLGAWTLQDYLSAKSVHAAEAAEAVVAPDPQPVSASSSASQVADAEEPAESGPDPYADPDFRVARHGRSASLKDKLLQQAEQKARAELLAQLHQHAQRSQYDCEALDHAHKYFKAGLDVWGFTTWQAKYFPMEGYQGATVAQCQQIQSAIDPVRMNLKSAVAQSAHP